MKKEHKLKAIAYCLNPIGADMAEKHLVNIGYDKNNFKKTMNSQVIHNFRYGEVDFVAVQTHMTDETVWKSQLPMCKHLMQEAQIKYVILKTNA